MASQDQTLDLIEQNLPKIKSLSSSQAFSVAMTEITD